MRPQLFLLACSLVVPACAQNPPRACTEIGCGASVHINVQKASGWQPGAYTVTTTVDGTAHTCTVNFPLSCDAPSSCASDVVLVSQNGCALPAAEQSLGGIDLTVPASSVSIEISHDGTPLGSGKFSPTYEELRPNGAGCDPVCRGSRDDLTLRLQ